MTQAAVILRKDYLPSAFSIDSINLRFDIESDQTTVKTLLAVRRTVAGVADLLLDGDPDISLVSVHLDGVELAAEQFTREEAQLCVHGVPEAFVLQVITRIHPAKNTALEGLYLSDGVLCTQCEAQGFRRITYFLDRPDVLTRYTVKIIADKAQYPVLLSNGNRIKSGDYEDGRHFVVWEDPYPKPSYLFALVAGDLSCVREHYVTASNREVDLEIYARPEHLPRCGHAMYALQNAMRWDEERYGLEYDLDVYMIVAVDFFNMGAMENKGLNVFNSRFVLCDPSTATDADIESVEAVIAHEYFHNWTGNRVTCRDWFQLSLKEGLTVYREQQYMQDQHSRAVQRIAQVRLLREHQFPEDAGPMAHPVRPDEYVEINNFYTMTVYEKGAEVIRMLHSIVGEKHYFRGVSLYLQRHDGQAATCDDFVNAMADASGADLSQFRRWYSTAGTPRLRASVHTQGEALHLTLQQHCPDTPGQTDKAPLHIPVRVGLIERDGSAGEFVWQGERVCEAVLMLRESEQVFVLESAPEGAQVSWLRDASAPVVMEFAQSIDAQLHQLAHDTDSFNRWDAVQSLYHAAVWGKVDSAAVGRALRSVLDDASLDPAFVAEVLTLPSATALASRDECWQIDVVIAQRAQCWAQMSSEIVEALAIQYDAQSGDTPGSRALKNICLQWLCRADQHAGLHRARAQYQSADTMTDTIAALRALQHCGDASEELGHFFTRWQSERGVIDKWFSLQAQHTNASGVRALFAHPAFDWNNPNRVRSVAGAFAQQNFEGFHGEGGYAVITEVIERLDSINPMVGARLASALTVWRRLDAKRADSMRAQLQRLQALPGLSRDLYEVVEKSLAGD